MSSSARPPLLAIDLGRDSAKMAVLDGQGPRILANAEGHAETPTWLYLEEDGTPLVGEEARQLSAYEPEHCTPIPISGLGDPRWRIGLRGTELSPQELVARLLEKLRDDAEALLGTLPTQAVVAVPHGFDSAQRDALQDAVALAGLECLSLIQQASAAAVGAGLPLGDVRPYILCDLSASALTVHVLRAGDHKVTPLTTFREPSLGAQAWDGRLASMLDEAHASSGALRQGDRAELAAFGAMVRAAKHALSHKKHADVAPTSGAPLRTTRQDFEAKTRDLLIRVQRQVVLAMREASLTSQEIGGLVMLGGGSRMPMVRAALAQLFRKAPYCEQPMYLTAMGAAVAGTVRHRPEDAVITMPQPVPIPQGAPPEIRAPEPRQSAHVATLGLADGGHAASDLQIDEVTHHALGIVVLDTERQERVVELIPSGVTLPYEFRGRFAYAYDNMTCVRVEVTEGTGTRRDEVRVVAVVELADLPPRPKNTPLEIVYAYDADRSLRVRVIDVDTGRWRDARVTFRGALSAAERQAAAARMAPPPVRG